jgi:hypothetical protein
VFVIFGRKRRGRRRGACRAKLQAIQKIEFLILHVRCDTRLACGCFYSYQSKRRLELKILSNEWPMFPEQTSVRDLSSRLSFLRRSCNDLHTYLTLAEPWLFSSQQLSAKSYNVRAKHIDVSDCIALEGLKGLLAEIGKRFPFSIVLIYNRIFFFTTTGTIYRYGSF